MKLSCSSSAFLTIGVSIYEKERLSFVRKFY
jgi:hypothetical protein